MDRDPIIDTLHGARLEQGMSQGRLAELIDTTRSTVAMYEGDYCLPSLRRLHAWADALGYDLVLVKREGG